MAALVRGLVARHSDPRCALGALEAATAPLGLIGWEVTVDPSRLTHGAAGRAVETGLGDRVVGLSTLADPLAAAASYLLVHWTLRLEDVLDLRMRDVAADAAAVRVDEDWLAVPQVERPYLRGLLALRRFADAGPHEFFLDAPDLSRSVRTVRSLVRVPLALLELEPLERDLADRPGPQARWLAERGVRLRWIGRADRARRGSDIGAVRDEMETRARALGGRLSPCRCATRHRAPIWAEVPVWPAPTRRAPNGPTHPWRR